MKTVVIVQARTGSTRFPGKILKEVLGEPLLIHQLNRIKAAKLADEIIVATTNEFEDNKIIDLCLKFDFKFFRGSKEDLLDRHYKAAREFSADFVVKIPSDCPLIDSVIIDKVIEYFIINQDRFDFVSNLHPATYPDGNDVEIMHFKTLKEAWMKAEKGYELEHTTPFIWDNPYSFKIGNVEWESGLNYSKSHRFTLDYEEDYYLIKRIYEELYPINQNFNLNDILELLEIKPEIKLINKKYAGEYWYRHNLNELKTVEYSI